MRLLLITSVLLSGCTSLEVPYWVKTWEGAKTVEVRIADQPNTRDTPWSVTQGWTVCDKLNKHCTIFIRSNAPRQCVERHERKHAAGWDHPNYEYSMEC